VIVEPSELGSSAGITAVYDFVLSAKKSVDMTMYELVDPAMVRDLVADDKRHVKVRVILDTNREQSRNGPAFRTLRAGGVKVVWADTSYEATHQKTARFRRLRPQPGGRPRNRGRLRRGLRTRAHHAFEWLRPRVEPGLAGPDA
jgi:phosphatidylserine/phosphatidylglycerophosphate/cardiolipin synthase-like enzyme